MQTKFRPFQMDRFFQSLADRTRLRLLNLIGDRELCVCYLIEILKQPQSKISRHLAYLRAAGLVATRQEGKWRHYRLLTPADQSAARMLAEVRSWFLQDKEMQADLAGLTKACCKPEKFALLRDAPRPVMIRNSASA